MSAGNYNLRLTSARALNWNLLPYVIDNNDTDMSTGEAKASDLKEAAGTPGVLAGDRIMRDLSEAIAANTRLLGQLALKENAPKGPSFQPPIYTASSDQCFEAWLDELLEHFNYMQMSTAQRSRALPMVLGGRPKLYYQSLPEGIRGDLEACIHRLAQKFGKASQTPLNIYQQLDKSQGDTESVSDYIQSITLRMRNAGIEDEAHQVAIFTKGLRADIKSELIKMRPANMQEAEQFALVIEESQKLRPVNDVNEVISALQKQVAEQSMLMVQAISENKRVRFHSPAAGGDSTRSRNSRSSDRSPYRSDMRSRDRSNNRNSDRSPYRSNNRNSDRSPYRSNNRSSERIPYRNNNNFGGQSGLSNNRSSRGRSINRRGGYGSQAGYGHNGISHPFCRQCQQAHAWGDHINPICASCGRRGHTAGQCWGN
jgi:hypothetical protein